MTIEKQNSLKTLKIVGGDFPKKKVDELGRLCKAVYWARDLVNEPANMLF